MSRAVRRQQAAAPKRSRGLKRRASARSSRRQTRGAKPPVQHKRRSLASPGWLDDIWSELKKVTWPTREETAYLTMVVIIVALAVGALLGGVDIFFNWLIDQLLLR